MPDNPVFDPNDAQKEILKKYISNLRTPEQLRAKISQDMQSADSGFGNSVMDDPGNRAIYKVAHDPNYRPESLVMGMGMPGIGMIKEGNVLNIMDELAAKKGMPSANLAGEEGQVINAARPFNDAYARMLKERAAADPIEEFKNRFGDNIPEHIEKNAGQPHDEPYSHGAIENLVYRSGNRDNPGVAPKSTSWGGGQSNDKLWNSPSPVPRKFDYEQSNGVLGKGVPDGSGPDPFMWMDNKYQTGKQALIDSKGSPLDIHTRSDLIAHDDYLANIDKDNHKVFMHIPPSQDMNIGRALEPGAPSILRRLEAAQKLKDAGVDVHLVQDQLVPPKMDVSQAQAFQQAITGSAESKDPRIWGTMNKFDIQPNEIQLGPQQMQNINKSLGTDFKPLVRKKK